jgi:hypothetical protein
MKEDIERKLIIVMEKLGLKYQEGEEFNALSPENNIIK